MVQLVIFRIDYCNSVLVSLPASTLATLQLIQNAAARLILGLSYRSHIKQLHWLPIKFGITFEVATLMYNIFPSIPHGPSGIQPQCTSASFTTRSAVVRRTRT